MKITILYDNTVWSDHLIHGWGFSCLVESQGQTILFDTGADGTILAGNMSKLDINPLGIDSVFISHNHADHTGGLFTFLRMKPANVCIPASCEGTLGVLSATVIKDKCQLYDNIYSTGELNNIEQSLVIKQGDGVVVITGCSHPGVSNILQAASDIGKPHSLIGGLHGFNNFDIINALNHICPTHCTQHIEEIKALYPEKFIRGGAGKVIEI